MKIKGGVLLATKELEWIKCLNRDEKFSKKGELGERRYKTLVEEGFKILSDKIDLFLEEINELAMASESKLDIDPTYREKMLGKIFSGASRFLEPLMPFERVKTLEKALEGASMEFFTFQNRLIFQMLYNRLRKINVHPGITSFEEDLTAIFDELGLDPEFIMMRKNNENNDGFYGKVKPPEGDIFDQFKKLSNEELQSAVNKVIFGNILEKPLRYTYWSIRKEYFDKQFLLEHRKRALKFLEEIKNGIVNKRKKILKDLYIRGLVNENKLNKVEIIENYHKNALESAKGCEFNRVGFNDIKIACKCIKNVEVFKAPKSFHNITLHLTEYGKELLNELTN